MWRRESKQRKMTMKNEEEEAGKTNNKTLTFPSLVDIL